MTFAPVNKSKTKAYTGCVTTDKLLDELLSEKRRDIDEGDVNRLHREIFTNKNTALEAIIQQYYDDLYGTENAPKDEFGKLYAIEPTSEQKSRALNSFLNNLQKAINKKEEEKEKRKREQEKKLTKKVMKKKNNPQKNSSGKAMVVKPAQNMTGKSLLWMKFQTLTPTANAT